MKRSNGCRSSSNGFEDASTLSRRWRQTAADVDAAVETLAEVAELAKQAEAEILRVRQAADAGA